MSQYLIGRVVPLKSTQTTKNICRIEAIEYDRYHGPQYLVSVPDSDRSVPDSGLMGCDYFWVRSKELVL